MQGAEFRVSDCLSPLLNVVFSTRELVGTPPHGVMLAGASLPPLLAVLPLYLRQRDWVHAVICALEVGVIVLAASGVLTAGH